MVFSSRKLVLVQFLLLACVTVLSFEQILMAESGQGISLTVTVGPAAADVIGTDNVAIQKAIDQVAATGGGVVLVKAGTYTLLNSVRLASHMTLRGEGTDKTVLRKEAGVKSRLKIDADYGEFEATVENGRGFAVGMGVAIVDKLSRSGWTPSVRTIVVIEGDTLRFDRFLHMDYSVDNEGEVFNNFPLVAGYEVEDVRVENLSVDGNREGTEFLDGCQSGGIYFFHSKRLTIRNCVARNCATDGISAQFVEDPAIENCEAYGNGQFGIHVGTGALRPVVRQNRSHNNQEDGIYLCWRVQHGLFEQNQSWSNGQDGISIGHKDTDNLISKNILSGNGRSGVFFRNEAERNAGHRNIVRENKIEDNGRAGSGGYGIRIEGATRNLTLISNTIRETRKGNKATQNVGIYIGPRADYIKAERNIFDGNMKQAIVDESQGGHNELEHPSVN